ncbi:MAG: hypothetical protein A2V66_10605 [Ignavibacteria bacterium RBG_13_36_8]|nr:MAG: hypothetical protein A2V66_10605 [Ignavibacteria bacterium RBG_13_36_8]
MNQKLKTLNFSHDYHKLCLFEFTTIRGKSRFNDFAKGERIEIQLNRKKLFNAILSKKELKKIRDIPISCLRQDGEYQGFSIKSTQDFIDLMNSFYPRKTNSQLQINIESTMSIFYLSRTFSFPLKINDIKKEG